jgi:EpsI family protein
LEAPLKKITPVQWIIAALMAVMIMIEFRVPIEWMYKRWVLENSYYSHGFFVPLVALWLVWRDRTTLFTMRGGTTWPGLVMLVSGQFILLFSGLTHVFFTGMFGMILTIWGLAGFLFGSRLLRRLWFPVFILAFMVPLPLAIIAKVSLSMKLMAAEIAILLIGALGIPVVSDGSTIYLSEAVITVGNACSGLRSLISLIFLGVLFAWLSDLSSPRKGVLFLSAIPIAILANVARVFALCLIAYTMGEEAIIGTVHDISGYLIFIVAFVLLFGVMKILSIGLKPVVQAVAVVSMEPVVGKGRGPLPLMSSLRARVILALIMLCSVATVSALALYREKMVRGSLKAANIPLVAGEWYGVEEPISEETKRILETDDVITRSYSVLGENEPPVQMAVVYSPDNRRVAHPPEVCYKGAGWECSEKVIVEHEGIPPLVRLKLASNRSSQDVVLYCYKAGDDMTANYYRQQFNIITNQILMKATSSALLRFSTGVMPNESHKDAERRIVRFVREILPGIRETLKDE